MFHQEPAANFNLPNQKRNSELVLLPRGVKQNEDWTLFCPNEAYDPETGTGLFPGIPSTEASTSDATKPGSKILQDVVFSEKMTSYRCKFV